MRTSVKVVLAAVCVAAVAYPVMAQTVRNGYVQPDLSTDNAFWGLPYPTDGRRPAPAYQQYPTYEHRQYGHPDGYGSAARPPVVQRPAGGVTPAGTSEGVRTPIIDCVHVLVFQCSGGG
jgi:hypothetical protein